MPAPISIVIPTLNCAHQLGPLLACLTEASVNGLVREVIFADGGSKDGLVDLAEEVGATVVAAAMGRGSQLAAGADVAKGEWLLFLHADTVLSEGWMAEVQAHLGRLEAAYFRLAFDANGFAARIVAGWANVRSSVFGLPYGDQGLLISRDLYDSVGGYDAIPLMEDVAMARKLRWRLRGLRARVVTSAQKYQDQGWVKRGGKNLWLLMRYFFGAKPADLAKAYRR